MYARKIITGLILLSLLATSIPFESVRADVEYRIGPGDVLEVSFWQDPDLNSQVRVGEDGNIALDIIGQIEAAGKTTAELQRDIVRLISRLNKNISQAVVRVTEYNYNYVFVTGQAKNPGKLTFEVIPDLWTIINEAGGVAESADLSRVTIIRGGEDAGQVEIVNVRRAIATGSLHKLPGVRREDTIEIPRTLQGLPSGDLVQSADKKDYVYVIGAVSTPGPIKFEENIDLLEIVALAGGPLADADLKKVQVVTKDGHYATTLKVNLQKYAESGKPSRYIVRKEDTVILPHRGGGILAGGLGTAVAVLGAVTSVFLLYDRLQN